MASSIPSQGSRMKRKEYITIACTNCKRRKVRCSGKQPCEFCLERNRECEYPTHQNRGPKRKHPKTLDDDDVSARTVDKKNQQNVSGESALAGKVACLERIVSQLMPQNPPLPDHGEQEAPNIFQHPAVPGRNLTLSSQLALLSENRSQPAVSATQQGRVTVHLPDPTILWSLVRFSLECMGLCYALMDADVMQALFRETLSELGYSHTRRELLVDAVHVPTIAILMNVLAIGQAHDSGSDERGRPGWCYYSQGCLLAHRLAYSGKVELPLVQFHVLSIVYLILVELLRSSSQAVVSAYQFATLMKLNNQAAWPSELSVQDRVERKRLWWILYYLDRRVAQKCGLPYHIRDTDFVVDDFDKSNMETTSNPTLLTDFVDKAAEDAWLQSLVECGRLWTKIWDGLFSVSATKLEDWEEIEVLDTRAVNLLKRLPPALQWSSEALIRDAANGTSDTSLYRRLMLFTNVNLVRALIRHSPLHPPATTTPESTRLSAEVAMEVMNAHLNFISTFPFTRMVGYFSIVSLVESMYHIIPALDEPSCQSMHASIRDSLQTTYDVVQQVAKKHNIARHALSALERVGPVYSDDAQESEQPKHEQFDTSATAETELPSMSEPYGDAMNSLFADIPYLAMSATEMNRTVDANWPSTEDEWQALFATHSIP